MTAAQQQASLFRVIPSNRLLYTGRGYANLVDDKAYRLSSCDRDQSAIEPILAIDLDRTAPLEVRADWP